MDEPRTLTQPLESERAVSELCELLAGGEATPWRGGDCGGLEPILQVGDGETRYVICRDERRSARIALSSRELEIARLISNGHTNRTIAVILDISPWTVSTHLRRIFAKLEVQSRAAMVGRLVAEGLLDAGIGE